MERILISQNENNDGTDYVVVNGELIGDEDLGLKYYRELRKSDNWKKVFKDEFLELKSNNNQILLKSHFLDKDNVNRNIYYTYFLRNNDSYDILLNQLENDSNVINRKVDRDRTLKIIKGFKSNKSLGLNITRILISIAAIGIAYYLINSLRN